MKKSNVSNEAISEKEDYHKLVFREIYRAAVEVFRTNAGVDLKWENVRARKKSHVSGDISAIVEMKGSPVSAKMALCFEKKVFLEIVSQMLGEEYSEINEDIRDAAAEMCNQVYGVAKARLVKVGCPFQMAIPKVILLEGHQVSHGDADVCVVVRFKNPVGLNLELSLEKRVA